MGYGTRLTMPAAVGATVLQVSESRFAVGDQIELDTNQPNQETVTIAWSLGNAYTAPGGIDVKIGPDGAGTITSYLLYQEAGGGGHVSPQVAVEVVVTVAKDHTATVKVTKQS